MEYFLTKKPRLANESSFKQISARRSKFERFNTTQYVTNFIIENLGPDPIHEFGMILGQLIDKAYENTRKQFGGLNPTMYNVLIDGQTLNQPITVSIHERIEGLDVEIVFFSY
jgi:hypothetical protein